MNSNKLRVLLVRSFAGVLLYMSLSATPPFYATSDAEADILLT